MLSMEMQNSAFASNLLKKEDSMEKRHCKAKHMYRPQPYDRSPPSASTSRSSTPSSPDQSSVDDVSNVHIHSDQKKQRREQANKRERSRMHTVNTAFDHLRELVPTYPSNRKLSKIETLRLACSYIQDLAKLVSDNNISMHGEDVNLLYQSSEMSESFNQYPNTAAVPPQYLHNQMSQKNEYAPTDQFDSSAYHYQPHIGYVTSDAESCPSESDVPSPPHHYMYMTSPGIAVRPPPAISRVNSDGSIIAMQMANASISSSSPTYCGSPSAGAPCSPLTRVQHSTPSISQGQMSSLQCSVTPFSSVQTSLSSIQTPSFPQCYSQ